MVKVYTKTGDKGKSSLYNGKRLDKYNPHFSALGTVDELIAYIGLLNSRIKNEIFEWIVRCLFELNSCIATPSGRNYDNTRFKKDNSEILEREIDIINDMLPPIKNFVLPLGDDTYSYINITRAVCRRAEREVWLLNTEEKQDDSVLKFLNRLSDYLFMLSRKYMFDNNLEEVLYIK